MTFPDRSTPFAEQRVDIQSQVAAARSLEKQGELQRATDEYERIIAKAHVPLAYHRLGVLYDKRGDFENAESHYEKALSADPENSDAWCDLGYSYYLQGRWSQAEDCLAKAIALQPDFVRAHNNLGMLYAKSGHNDKALAAFCSGGQTEAEAKMSLAKALLLDGKTEQAQDQLYRVVAVQPDHKQANVLLAQLSKSPTNVR
jgi:tetratricopeptide (TPR) repeat protein